MSRVFHVVGDCNPSKRESFLAFFMSIITASCRLSGYRQSGVRVMYSPPSPVFCLYRVQTKRATQSMQANLQAA